ncbi:hypothetical protein ACS8E3_08700 [Psychrobacter sp. 2Y5]|uniref:hypothetical protein n=1 Tax=unclassified Psychrobacter TaxID=196806 RepID=UPI003F48E461
MTKMNALKRKAILIFKSEKRLGAGAIVKTFNDKSIEEMKATIISEAMCDPKMLTYKPRTKDLTAHLENIKHQFIGQSELCFYHATLTILLRRGYKVTETFADFETLWVTETDYLLKNLSLRWIISATDTFVDHSPDPTRSAILMNAATLINTLKVYETQEFLYDDGSLKIINPVQKQKFIERDQSLYDGLTYFRIGNDDTLNNMRRRYKNFTKIDPLASQILLSIFDRLQYLDTAFALAKSLHSDSSIWWEDQNH